MRILGYQQGIKESDVSAFNEGVEAYHRGDTDDMNPYDDRDPQRDEWEDGWFTTDELEN